MVARLLWGCWRVVPALRNLPYVTIVTQLVCFSCWYKYQFASLLLL